MRRRELERACTSLEGRFDVVHIQTPFRAHGVGVRLARRLQLPVVESYHTYFEHYFHHYMPFVPRAWLAFAARSLSRRQCNAVDAVIAPSTQMADALAAYGIRTDIRVIPTGLDLERFRGGDGARFRARFGIEPGRPLMLTVSRVAYEKNIEFLLDVLALVRRAVPSVLLVVAGEGPALRSLERTVARRGLTANARFVGYLGPIFSTAIRAQMSSCSPRGPRLRDWWSSRRWRSARPSFRRRSWARETYCAARAARSWSKSAMAILRPP